MKENRGITLVALVITIIILLILAGITINFAFKQNGILNKAQETKTISEISSIKESLRLDILEKELEIKSYGYNKILQEDLNKIIQKYGELQEDGDTIITKEGYNISLKEVWQGQTGNRQEIALDGSWSNEKKVNKPNINNTGLKAIQINEDGSTSRSRYN